MIGFKVRKMFPLLVKFSIIVLDCNFVSIAEISVSDRCLDQKLILFRTRC